MVAEVAALPNNWCVIDYPFKLKAEITKCRYMVLHLYNNNFSIKGNLEERMQVFNHDQLKRINKSTLITPKSLANYGDR